MIWRTYDYEQIRGIVTHHSMYPHLVDDGSPSAADYQVLESDDIIYLLCEAGVYMFHPLNCVTVLIHVCVIEKYRGKSLAYVKAALQWVFTNTEFRKVVAHVPSYNRRAYVYAMKAGFKLEGTMTNSFKKDGTLYDQALLGFCAPCGDACH